MRWRELFDARGRANRTEYLTVTVLSWGAFIACGLLVHLLGIAFAVATSILILVVTVTLAIVGSIIAIRRLHDWGRSGWWLIAIVLIDLPFAAMGEPRWFPETFVMIGVLLQTAYAAANLIVFSAVPGQRRPNRFGPPPGTPPTDEVFV